MSKDSFKFKSKVPYGFHVYRSENPNLPFMFWKRITKTPVRTESFIDPYAKDDDKYYYYKMTDVDIYGKESAPYDPPKQAWIKRDGSRETRQEENRPVVVGRYLYYSTDPDLPLDQWQRTTEEPITKSSFEMKNLTAGLTYYYYVTNVYADGSESPRSEIISAQAHD